MYIHTYKSLIPKVGVGQSTKIGVKFTYVTHVKCGSLNDCSCFFTFCSRDQSRTTFYKFKQLIINKLYYYVCHKNLGTQKLKIIQK